MKERADTLLVCKGFFDSREKAKRAIMAGLVIINNIKVDKPGTNIKIDEEPDIRIKGEVCKYVSRGGLKLEKAITAFNMDFSDKIVLDVGSSTGGFTDCALQNGAKFVYAVDVGTNQLDWKLRNNPKVKSLENTHIKDLLEEDLDNIKVDYIVMDVSFISITKVIKHLIKFCKKDTKIMALIKPQFEVGKENIEKGGIVKNKSYHVVAIKNVIIEAKNNNLSLLSLDISPITGMKGNIEYLSIFAENNCTNEAMKDIDIDEVVNIKKL